MFWFLLGLLLIYVGVKGNFGSMLAALIVPDALVDTSNGK
jgi:hypothetical protein